MVINMETIEAGGIVYRVIRSARKSICLRIGRDGEAEILAPVHLPRETLLEYAEKYAAQMGTLREKKKEQLESRRAFALQYGDRLRVLGGERILTPQEGIFLTYDEHAYYVPQNLDEANLRRAVIQLYKLHASRHIPRRTMEIAARMGLAPSAVKINCARSHWGSCSGKNSLNFSWISIMASESALDYIIIHELCHMRHFDHSPAFWTEVGRWCPDYKREKAYLAELWRKISAENWI